VPRLQHKTAETADQNCLFWSAVAIGPVGKGVETVVLLCQDVPFFVISGAKNGNVFWQCCGCLCGALSLFFTKGDPAGG